MPQKNCIFAKKKKTTTMSDEEEYISEFFDKDKLLKDEIKDREDEYADILSIAKTLSKSIKLYSEKCDLKARAGYLILASSNCHGIFEYDTMRIKMLEFIAEEMHLLGSRLDRFSKRIKDSHLLPYAKEDVENVLYPCLEKVDYFKPNSLSNSFGRENLEEATKKTQNVWFQLRKQLYYFDFANSRLDNSSIESVFSSILGRYERDNRAMLDNYMSDIDDVKEAKKGLKNRLGGSEAVTIWESEGRNIVRTIREMSIQGHIEKDLLPLLEYKAKHDRLTERENGKKPPKTEESAKWEDAIPKCLREGKLSVAWKNLQQKGILKDDYQLAEGIPPAAAHHLVIAFCRNCPTLKQNDWKSFSNFWGITKLKDKKSRFAKATENTINNIFMNL